MFVLVLIIHELEVMALLVGINVQCAEQACNIHVYEAGW